MYVTSFKIKKYLIKFAITTIYDVVKSLHKLFSNIYLSLKKSLVEYGMFS